VLFKKTAKLLAVFLVYILFFLLEESFYSEKAVLKSLGLLLYFFSEESSRGRTGDANLHELSDMVVTLINDNRLVLFCSTHHRFYLCYSLRRRSKGVNPNSSEQLFLNKKTLLKEKTEYKQEKPPKVWRFS
jgi:hypothetical protein